jgi:hypothetical protein
MRMPVRSCPMACASISRRRYRRNSLNSLLCALLLVAVHSLVVAGEQRRASNDERERLVDIPVNGDFVTSDDHEWGAGFETDDDRDYLERCLVAAEGMPPLYPLKEYRRDLFPWLERSTIPSSLKGWLDLARNRDVAGASREVGVRYWFLWNTRDRTELAKGGIICGGGFGAGGCFGLTWAERKTVYRGLLIDVYRARVVGFPAAEVTGNTVIPAFILPIPLIAQTPSAACSQVAEVLVRTIKSSDAAP